MEVYIDDMLVKSLNAGGHLKHLQETFNILRRYNVKLNPVRSGLVLVGSWVLGLAKRDRGLELARELGSEVIEIKCDSQLVVNQLYGIKHKGRTHATICEQCSGIACTIQGMVIIHIPRKENVEAYAFANLGSSMEMKGSDSGTAVQLLHSVLDVDGYCKVNSSNLVWDWRNEFVEYLRHGKLPEDPKASRALRTKVLHYCLMDGQLYRRLYHGPLARCLGSSEANYVMREVHERICGNHSGADSLVLKLVRAGYYWPRMEQDAKTFVQKCDKSQRYAQLVHQPTKLLHSLLSP
ncbi:uncharacterized protein [Nicotiana tomentosiformis]|uniref:uncharacterized protein n=1 Tax=Nicotiana tomentosiformis TaxID=4098 RepID=UPI00388C39FC